MIYYPQPMNGGAFGNAPSCSYPLGYGGYNGGYYGGLYNTYNPYEIQKQQQLAQQRYQEDLNNQRNIIATFYKSSCIPGNGDPKKEILNQIYGKEDDISNQQIEGLDTMQTYEYNSYKQKQQQLSQQQQMCNQMIKAPYIDYKYNSLCDSVNKIYNDRIQEVSEDMGLFEYLSDQVTKDILKAEDNNIKAEQSNLGSLYDTNGYNKFLNQFKQSGPFAALNPNASIDDLTISLPSMVSEQQRAARRKAFLAQIGLG